MATKLSVYVRHRNLLPGACLSRLDVTPATMRRYVKRGWVVIRGLPMLTVAGYRAA